MNSLEVDTVKLPDKSVTQLRFFAEFKKQNNFKYYYFLNTMKSLLNF